MTQPSATNRKSAIRHWPFVIVLLLLTWGLRISCLEDVPPGWRDDELIEIHALAGEVLEGHFPLYFTGASGHEPLYHYLRAIVHAVLGYNVMSGHLLSVAFGTLTIALTFALTRRCFGYATAAIASLALTTSFWSLMYSRTAIRHISLLPFALAAFLLVPVLPSARPARLVRWVSVGLLVGASLYTYPAARLLPVMLVLFALYLALYHREQFSHHWRGLLLALLVTAILALPLGVAIALGRSEAAAQGIGADARLAELAVPLRELLAGNPRPMLEGIWTTLGMFHATGDPEWLYNISNRPVFNLFGALLLWAGVVLCLYRWRQPRYFFLLLWLGLGLLPAAISIPPASLSHTILAQPVVYILPALVLIEVRRLSFALRRPLLFTVHGPLFIVYCSLFVFLTTNAIRDLRDYFIAWPERGMVRLLYRADYREAARYLNHHPEIPDIAISSTLMGPWDRIAMETDTHENVTLRLFDPERALVWVSGNSPSAVLLTSLASPASPVDNLLETNTNPPEAISPYLTLYTLPPIPDALSQARNPLARFANGLELLAVRWMNEGPLVPGQEVTLLTTWLVATPLDLPPLPIVANPPPPGVYSGPRLAVFTHLLAADGTLLAGDDGLWVDPLTLRPGDRFIQAHHLLPSPDAPSGPYTLELGLYDPKTEERWPILQADGQPGPDHLLIPTEEEP
jgi:hypothetical protein